MISLKPCPFCGLKPDLNDGDTLYPTAWYSRWDEDFGCYIAVMDSMGPPLPTDKQIWKVQCVETAGGCGAELHGHSMEEAVVKWNTRTNADQPR